MATDIGTLLRMVKSLRKRTPPPGAQIGPHAEANRARALAITRLDEARLWLQEADRLDAE